MSNRDERCRNARAKFSLIRWYDCNQTRAAFHLRTINFASARARTPTRIGLANRWVTPTFTITSVYIGGNATRFADFVLLCAKAVRNSSSMRSDTTALLSTTATFKPLTPCRGFISFARQVNGQFFFLLFFPFQRFAQKNTHYIMHVVKINEARKWFVIDLG